MNCVAEGSIEDDSWHMQSMKANENKNQLSDRSQKKVLVKLRLSDVREFSSLENQKKQSLKVVFDCEKNEEDSTFGESSPKKCFSSNRESTPKIDSITKGIDCLKFKQVNSFEPIQTTLYTSSYV